jgi:hypothetical protein
MQDEPLSCMRMICLTVAGGTTNRFVSTPASRRRSETVVRWTQNSVAGQQRVDVDCRYLGRATQDGVADWPGHLGRGVGVGGGACDERVGRCRGSGAV